MAINVKTVTCPACGAKVNYDENNKIAKCEFCGAVLDMTEEYGEKKDRERDDMQDMQIKNIMSKMNGRTTTNNTVNINKAKKKALIIVIVFIFIMSGSVMYSIMRNSVTYFDSIKKSANSETVSDIVHAGIVRFKCPFEIDALRVQRLAFQRGFHDISEIAGVQAFQEVVDGVVHLGGGEDQQGAAGLHELSEFIG